MSHWVCPICDVRLPDDTLCDHGGRSPWPPLRMVALDPGEEPIAFEWTAEGDSLNQTPDHDGVIFRELLP